MLEFVKSHNGTLISEDGTRSTLSSPQTVQALTFVREQIIHQLASPAVLTYQEPESLALFVQGKAVFHRNWPYAWGMANHPRYSKIVGKVGIDAFAAFYSRKECLGSWWLAIWGKRLFPTSPRSLDVYRVHDQRRDTKVLCHSCLTGSITNLPLLRRDYSEIEPPISGFPPDFSDGGSSPPHTSLSDRVQYPATIF